MKLFAFLVAVTAVTAAAQTMTPCMQYPSDVYTYPIAADIRATTAFTATSSTTFERQLADGNVIRRSSTGFEARDAQGRDVLRSISGCTLDSVGQPQYSMSYSVTGPPSYDRLSWTVGPGAQHLVTRQKRYAPLRDIPKTPGLVVQEGPVRTEDLGTREIAGFTAQGRRTVRTTLAGASGNERPIESTYEVWTVPDKHLTLMAITDDPLTGKRLWQVTSFTEGPPDPSLFQPPADYVQAELDMNTHLAKGTAPDANP